jgi:processing peptidase subunit alpha
MYTRLYTQVLNQYHWAESAECFVSIHNDSGIFGIDGACMAENAESLVQVMLDHLVRLSLTQVSDEELDRAKNMLRSMMMMQLESRLVVCEDIARQFLTYGFREMPGDVSKRIESVTKEDLQNVARHMMRSVPVMSCVGSDLSKVPPYEDVKKSLDAFREAMLRL